MIQNGLAVDEEVTKFCSYYHKSFVAAASYLEVNLPFTNKILKYAQYIFYYSEKQNSNGLSLNSMSNLTLLKIANVFGSKATNIFNVSFDKTQAEIIDLVRHQWKMYQLEEIPESVYLVQVKSDSGKVC